MNSDPAGSYWGTFTCSPGLEEKRRCARSPPAATKRWAWAAVGRKTTRLKGFVGMAVCLRTIGFSAINRHLSVLCYHIKPGCSWKVKGFFLYLPSRNRNYLPQESSATGRFTPRYFMVSQWKELVSSPQLLVVRFAQNDKLLFIIGAVSWQYHHLVLDLNRNQRIFFQIFCNFFST